MQEAAIGSVQLIAHGAGLTGLRYVHVCQSWIIENIMLLCYPDVCQGHGKHKATCLGNLQRHTIRSHLVDTAGG